MKILIHQSNPLVGDVLGNAAALRDAWQRARAAGADLVVTPELALCGYPPRDLLDRRALLDAVERALDELAALTADGPALLVGAPVRTGADARLRNSAWLLDGGARAQVHHKCLLPDYDVFDEPRHFAAGSALTRVQVRGRTLLLSICEDIWAAADPNLRARYGCDPLDAVPAGSVDLCVNLSASPWSITKRTRRREVVSAVARRLGAPLLYVNQAGGNDELLFDGGSLLANPDGGTACVATAFAQAEGVVELADSRLEPRCGFGPEPEPMALLHAGLVAGIADYVRKSGFGRVVLGLSGGIDSALTAALAVDALGADRVTGLLMPSRYSSQGSVDDALALAGRLGIQTHTLSVEPAFEALLGTLAPAFAGRQADLTEENLQARIRGVLLMAFSNKSGSLLLTTGNKSELAVGYCTLYGDMCGALAPIADLVKTRVWALARWMNRETEVIPWNSITKAPSAELRPDQTDQDSLPAYELLDAIVEAYVERSVPAAELDIPGVEPSVLARMLRLIDLNEYKRRQAAPGLRVTDRAFGMGRRYPVAAAGASRLG